MKLDLLAATRALCQLDTQAASQAPVTAENGKRGCNPYSHIKPVRVRRGMQKV
ncbi:MAG: hypothetical protein AABY81_02480 [Pseudomonadota bacterium]